MNRRDVLKAAVAGPLLGLFGRMPAVPAPLPRPIAVCPGKIRVRLRIDSGFLKSSLARAQERCAQIIRMEMERAWQRDRHGD